MRGKMLDFMRGETVGMRATHWIIAANLGLDESITALK